MAGGGSAIIGALRVVLGADTAAFEDGLKGASGKLDSFGSSAGKKLDSFASGVTKAAAVVSVAMIGAVTALGYAVSQSVDKIDNLGKAAQKAGAPVEEFSKLASSAGKVKIGVDELAGGMEKLAKNMSAFAGGGPVTEAGRAFQALGIKVKDAGGNLKSSSEVISELAGKFEQFQDGPAKTALAIAIFGKAGAEMIPLLNQGSAALKKTADEMESLGIVIDQKTFKSAEQFNQSLTRLGKVQDSIIMKLTVGMLPALNDVTAELVKASKNTELMQSVSETLSSIFKIGAETGIALAASIASISAGLAGLVAAAKLLGSGEFTKAWEALKAGGAESDKIMAQLAERLANLWSKPGTDALDYKAILDQVEASMTAVANVKLAAPILANSAAIDKFVDSTKKSLAAQDAETQTVGMAAGAKEKLRVVLQGLEVATANHIPRTAELRAKLDELGVAAEQSALKLAGTQLVFANKDPLTLYQTELANTQAAMNAVGATAEQLGRNNERIAQQFGMSWQNIGSNIASTAGALSQLTGTFAKENKAMAILSKTFAFGQIAINTAVAVTKALASLPPPASYVAVGLAIATGAAQAAAVAAQGFAKGGSFMVPGGMSGVDNQMIPLNLASGERVDITPANEARGGGRGVSEIRLLVSSLRDILTGENLRDTVDALNAGHRDGYILKVAVA